MLHDYNYKSFIKKKKNSKSGSSLLTNNKQIIINVELSATAWPHMKCYAVKVGAGFFLPLLEIHAAKSCRLVQWLRNTIIQTYNRLLHLNYLPCKFGSTLLQAMIFWLGHNVLGYSWNATAVEVGKGGFPIKIPPTW